MIDRFILFSCCRVLDKVRIFISSMHISLPIRMLDHLLYSSGRDDSNKWSNKRLYEEITKAVSFEVYLTHLILSSVVGSEVAKERLSVSEHSQKPSVNVCKHNHNAEACYIYYKIELADFPLVKATEGRSVNSFTAKFKSSPKRHF